MRDTRVSQVIAPGNQYTRDHNEQHAEVQDSFGMFVGPRPFFEEESPHVAEQDQHRHVQCPTKNKRSVCDPLFEILRLAPFGIHVMRIEVACLTGVHHDVGFRDRSACRCATEINFEIFEIDRLAHGLIPRFRLIRFAHLRTDFK